MSEIVQCPNCGQKNRINPKSTTDQAVCAKCWARLALKKEKVQAPRPPEQPHSPPPPTGKSSETPSSGFSWVWVIIFGIGLLWVFTEGISTNTVVNTSGTSNQQSKPSFNQPLAPLPKHGFTLIYPDYINQERIAPFEINTQRGQNYYVKLVEAKSSKTVMIMFIHGGRKISTEVPLGNYLVKYASGKKWYGYEHLFGPNTQYSKAEETFSFKNTGYQVTGYSMTLYTVRNGNLQTTRIPPSQF